MLYVYSFFKYEEEWEELNIVVENIKELKPLGESFKYISNRNDKHRRFSATETFVKTNK